MKEIIEGIENLEPKAGEGCPEGSESAAQGQTYTEEQVRQLLQSEVDRRVTAALKKAEKKTAYAVREAERLAKLSEEERNKEQIALLQKELAERERQISIRENKIACISEMAKRGIPTALVDFIVTEDADEMLGRLDTFEKTLRELVNEEVSKRLTSSVPKAGVPRDALPKESLKNLSLSELNELYRRDPEKFKALTAD